MRIGILTQPLGHNYGGILQNYALQQHLISMGHDPITIDVVGFECTLWQRLRAAVQRPIVRMLKKAARCPAGNENMHQPLTRFIATHIRRTRRHYAPIRSGILDEHGLEALIVGSDQVWRPSYSPNIRNFFLDFCEGRSFKTIAYAASFGNAESEYSPELARDCARLLQRFDAVSVREAASISRCGEIFGVSPELTCDPTLLLGQEHYRSIASPPFPTNSQTAYCACYILDPTSTKMGFIRNWCSRHGIAPLSLLPIAPQHTRNDGYVFAPSSMLPVEDWLGLLAHATAIITDSFHGTVFSIVFGKPFFALDNPMRGSDRIRGLLELAELTSCLVDPVNSGGGPLSMPVASSWTRQPLLHELICSSKGFLDRHIIPRVARA